jgi:hypothetical protein
MVSDDKITNDEMERVLKEAVLISSRYNSGICPKGLRKPKEQKPSVRITSVAATIRTKHLQIHYH